MSPFSSPYRDGSDAVRLRHIQLQKRLRAVDDQLARHRGSISATLRDRLAGVRARAEPAGTSAEDVLVGEREAHRLERALDEALGLTAELQRTVDSVLPPAGAMLRWAAMSGLSAALLALVVAQLGLGDFMLQAFGVKVLRATATMPCDRFSFEAERAARGGQAPPHAEWRDPRPFEPRPP